MALLVPPPPPPSPRALIGLPFSRRSVERTMVRSTVRHGVLVNAPVLWVLPPARRRKCLVLALMFPSQLLQSGNVAVRGGVMTVVVVVVLLRKGMMRRRVSVRRGVMTLVVVVIARRVITGSVGAEEAVEADVGGAEAVDTKNVGGAEAEAVKGNVVGAEAARRRELGRLGRPGFRVNVQSLDVRIVVFEPAVIQYSDRL